MAIPPTRFAAHRHQYLELSLPMSPDPYHYNNNSTSDHLMASSTRALTPTHNGRFQPTSAVPYTPTSISSAANILQANSAKDNALLHPPSALATAGSRHATLSPKSVKPALSPNLAPQPLLTGAGAQEEERRYRESLARERSQRTSPNPARTALNSLLGGGMSGAKDAPAATSQLSAPLAQVAKSISIPEPSSADQSLQTSPVSMSSFGSIDPTTAPTATAMPATITSGPLIAEPGNTDSPVQQAGPGAPPPPLGPNNEPSNRAFTYPPPLLGPDDPRQQHPRNMSLPMSGYGQQSSPKSPANKRHKCPYCSTDFTRHHNLKSHLLTHSQEKPYECPTCNSRFRRLHDLKRHTKLHTGERPHTCNKCGRRFARGDALARHAKGQGGCAGRRASFADDGTEAKVEGMEGVEYTDDAPEGERMGESPAAIEARRQSEPNKPRGPSEHGSGSQFSTYPPVSFLGRSQGHGMYPPQPSPGGSGTTGTTSSANHSSSATSHESGGRGMSSVPYGGMLPQGITESPKPLSPGQPDPNHRPGAPENNRPSLYGRPMSGPVASNMPPPANTTLPPLAPLSQDHRTSMSRGPQSGNRGPLQSSYPPGPSHLQHVSASSPAPPTPTSHSPGLVPGIESMYEHIRALEARMQSMQDSYENRIRSLENESRTRIHSLEEEISRLRGHQPPPQQHHPLNIPPQPQLPTQPTLPSQPGLGGRQ